MQRLLGFGQHRAVVRSRPLDRFERQAGCCVPGPPSRFAVAAAASSRPVATPASPLGPVPLADRDEAHDEGDDEGDGERAELDPEAPVGAALALDALRLAPLLPIAFRPADVDELALPGRQRVQALSDDVEGDVEPRPAVHGAGIPVELGPAGGGLAQLADRHDRLTVLVDPARNRGHARSSASWATSTVGSRVCGMAIEREQPGLCPGLDDVTDGLLGARRHQLGSRGAAAGGLAVRVHHDEPLEDLPNRVASTVVERAEELLGPRGDGGVDPTELPVAGQCEVAIGAALGQLVQRELQRRQRRGLVDDRGDQLGDQRRLDAARRPALGGPDDGGLELGGRHRGRR